MIQHINVCCQETVIKIALGDSFHQWWACGSWKDLGLVGTSLCSGPHSNVVHNDWSVWDGEAKLTLVALDEGVLEVAMTRRGHGICGRHRGAHEGTVCPVVAKVEVGCGHDVTSGDERVWL